MAALTRAAAAVEAIVYERPEDLEAKPDPATLPKLAGPLAKLGLRALVERTKKPPATVGEVMTCKATVTPLPMRPGGDEVLVLGACTDMSQPFGGAEHYEAVVLRPIAERAKEGAWCRLGGLDLATETGERPCLWDGDTSVPLEISAEPLVSADRYALRVRQLGGRCASGIQRGNAITTAFWVPTAEGLVEVFEATDSELGYDSPCPPTRELTGTLALIGAGFPKTLEHTLVTTCAKPEEVDASCEPDPTCRPSSVTTRYTWNGAKFTPSSDK